MVRARRRTLPWVILFVTILVVGVFYLAGGWYFSGQIHADGLRAEPYDAAALHTGTVESVEVIDDITRVTLLPSDGDLEDTKFDAAVMGMAIGESLFVVGPATVTDDGRRVRPILDTPRGTGPRPGDAYGLARDVWLTPEDAGLDAADVKVRSLEGGEFPAWRVRSRGSTKWAILTHGKGAGRSEMLRMGKPLHEAGYNLLFTTYTNDPGAPASDDGLVHYGRTEWQDLEAAVQYVLDLEASTIVLGGVSHGGAVTLGFLANSPAANQADAVILDSPVSSFGDAIDEQAEFRTLPLGLPIPESLEDVAKWIVAARYGVSFTAVDYITRPGLIDVPLLTFQGSGDRSVPRTVTDRFMREGSGQGGRYVVTEGAGHVLSWNYDPPEYEDAVTSFVEALTD